MALARKMAVSPAISAQDTRSALARTADLVASVCMAAGRRGGTAVERFTDHALGRGRLELLEPESVGELDVETLVRPGALPLGVPVRRRPAVAAAEHDEGVAAVGVELVGHVDDVGEPFLLAGVDRLGRARGLVAGVGVGVAAVAVDVEDLRASRPPGDSEDGGPSTFEGGVA